MSLRIPMPYVLLLAVLNGGPLLAGSSIIEQVTLELGLDESQARLSVGLVLLHVDERVGDDQFEAILEVVPNARLYMHDCLLAGQDRKQDQATGERGLRLRFEQAGLAPFIADEVARLLARYVDRAGATGEAALLRRVLSIT